MNTFMKNTKFQNFLVALLWCSLLLTGCGGKSSLENYQTDMNGFYENIISISTSINAIDPNSEGAVTELLAQLDNMNSIFSSMAALEVPEEFSSAESLSDDAAAHMSEAVTLYHQAFANNTYDQALGQKAQESYNNAMIHVQYIGQLLMGNIPEGEGITVTYE